MKKYSLVLILIVLCILGCPTVIDTSPTTTTSVVVIPANPSIIDTFGTCTYYYGGLEIGSITKVFTLSRLGIAGIYLYKNDASFDEENCIGTVNEFVYEGDNTDDKSLAGKSTFVFTANECVRTIYKMVDGSLKPVEAEYSEFHKKTKNVRLVKRYVVYSLIDDNKIKELKTTEYDNTTDQIINNVVYNPERNEIKWDADNKTIVGSAEIDYSESYQYDLNNVLQQKTTTEYHKDLKDDSWHVDKQINLYYWNILLPIKEPSIIENFTIDESGDLILNSRTFSELKETNNDKTSCIVVTTRNTSGDTLSKECHYYQTDPFDSYNSEYLIKKVTLYNRNSEMIEVEEEEFGHFYTVDGDKLYYSGLNYNSHYF